jgi:predicted  nucleic acid-binding Zn-ribbon protein
VAQHALPPPLSQALARLRASLGGLESAAERHGQQKEQQNSLATELALMQDDRARLASELDSAMARADRLAKSAKEIDKRLVSMARSVKKVLGEDKAKEVLGQEALDPEATASEAVSAHGADHAPAEGH